MVLLSLTCKFYWYSEHFVVIFCFLHIYSNLEEIYLKCDRKCLQTVKLYKLSIRQSYQRFGLNNLHINAYSWIAYTGLICKVVAILLVYASDS